MDALHDPALLQLVLRHSANAIRRKVCVPGLQRNMIFQNCPQIYHLDATKTTEVFITLFLPFGNQVGISYLLLRLPMIWFQFTTFMTKNVLVKYRNYFDNS